MNDEPGMAEMVRVSPGFSSPRPSSRSPLGARQTQPTANQMSNAEARTPRWYYLELLRLGFLVPEVGAARVGTDDLHVAGEHPLHPAAAAHQERAGGVDVL